MPVDVCSLVEGEGTSNPDGFIGAVFLTYTLSLTFYEGVVARALDRAACANILILADPAGYHDALRVGFQSIRNAGMRYVCAPLHRAGPGVIHAKAVLLLGPSCGRLIVGSGNLTLPGFGRNLELFSMYEHESADGAGEALYLIRHVWSLIEDFEAEGMLPSAAKQQLDSIRAKVSWLDDEAPSSPHLRIWDSRERSIWDQFSEWRNSRPSGSSQLSSLVAVSPFLDPDLRATKAVISELAPATTLLCTDPASARWNAPSAHWLESRRAPPLDVASLTPVADFRRPLHAKALIGVEDDGAWCLHGSANLTQPGLMKSWSNGGNLELAILHWSPDPSAFNYLLQEESFQVTRLDPSAVPTTSDEPSPVVEHDGAAPVITDLTYSRLALHGQLGPSSLVPGNLATLRFLKSGSVHRTTIDADGGFHVALNHPLEDSEAACVHVRETTSAYRWIDQPDTLARFSERTYHAQIQARLETPAGSAELFRELMDFLWQRLAHEGAKDGPQGIRRGTRATKPEPAGEDELIDDELPPPVEEFITDEELLYTIEYRIGRHLPYDRNLWSLRDLLSIVLLRLTASVSHERVESPDEGATEDEDEDRIQQLEVARLDAQARLCKYIRGYCRKYSAALADAEVVANAGPDLLFENHFTLGRVLMEVQAKLPDLISPEDLWEAMWLLWGPLVLPESIGRSDQPVVRTLVDIFGKDEVADAWERSGLGTMTVVLWGSMMGEPPAWDEGAHTPDTVEEFMLVRQLIEHTRRWVGPEALDTDPKQLENAVGFQRAVIMTREEPPDPPEEATDWEAIMARIAAYLPPSVERLNPFLSLVNEVREGRGGTDNRQRAIKEAAKLGLGDQVPLLLDRRTPVLPIKGDDSYCPRCFLELTETSLNRIRNANVVLCSSCREVFIYWRPSEPRLAI